MNPQPQSDTTFEAINQLIWKHLDERDWTGNSPRTYATSIIIEAAELLEHYQWSDTSPDNKEDITDELADVLIYCFQFAQATDINMTEAITRKLQKAAEKYPAHKFKGKAGTPESTDAYLEAKQRYRQGRKKI